MTEVVRLPTGQRRGNEHGLWPTATADSLQEIIENCRLSGQLGLITGPSGIGKTTAARAAVNAAEAAIRDGEDLDCDPTVVFASMTRAAEGLQPGLLRIAWAAHIPVSNHLGAHDVHDLLVSHHWRRGSLIVLDEAQFMTDALLHAVRNIWDELDQRRQAVGIVLVGTPDLAERINGRGKKAAAFEAFRGRLGACTELGSLEPDDCAAICRYYGLTEKSAEALIRRAAGQSGGLHIVKRLIGYAERAAGKGKRITFSDLTQAGALAGVGA